MSESAPLLEVRGFKTQNPGGLALKGGDFDVGAGEVHCLLGPNGAGKSTLIKCVSGVVEPTAGEILVEGEPLPVGDPAGSRRGGGARRGGRAGRAPAGGRPDNRGGARPGRGPPRPRKHLPGPRAAARPAA